MTKMQLPFILPLCLLLLVSSVLCQGMDLQLEEELVAKLKAEREWQTEVYNRHHDVKPEKIKKKNYIMKDDIEGIGYMVVVACCFVVSFGVFCRLMARVEYNQ